MVVSIKHKLLNYFMTATAAWLEKVQIEIIQGLSIMCVAMKVPFNISALPIPMWLH